MNCDNIFCRAYLKALDAEEEVVPPALNLTPRQLFWVGYAQNHCLLGGMYTRFDKIEDLLDSYRVKLFGIDKLNIKRSDIPAVTHVDYSARVQTVHKETNKKYYNLIKKFKDKTNCPVIVNTSFNVRGEPIVNTPEDAFNCFMGTELDNLVIGNCYLKKSEQDKSLKKNYTNQFELD